MIKHFSTVYCLTYWSLSKSDPIVKVSEDLDIGGSTLWGRSILWYYSYLYHNCKCNVLYCSARRRPALQIIPLIEFNPLSPYQNISHNTWQVICQYVIDIPYLFEKDSWKMEWHTIKIHLRNCFERNVVRYYQHDGLTTIKRVDFSWLCPCYTSDKWLLIAFIC